MEKKTKTTRTRKPRLKKVKDQPVEAKKSNAINFELIEPLDLFGLKDQALDINIEGFTTPKICGILNHLTSKGKTFVEIGTYRGVTLASAMHKNKVKAFGIDNYSWPTKVTTTRSPQLNLQTAISRAKGAEVIARDYAPGLGKIVASGIKIDCYFVDGPHNYEDVKKCIELAEPMFSESTYVVLDDANNPGVKKVIDDLDKKENWELIFEKLTDKEKNHPDWWNGIAIFQVKSK